MVRFYTFSISFFILAFFAIPVYPETSSLEIHHSPDSVTADKTLVAVTIRIPGNEKNNSQIHLILKSPNRSFFASTEFPHYEEKIILDHTVSARNGIYQFRFIPPIRGEYRLEAELINSNSHLNKTRYKFSVKENPSDILYISILIGLLFAAGLVSGLIFTRK